jgi:hypothetical protein
LPLRFSFLSQIPLDFAALLQITRFELVACAIVQTEPGLTQGCVRFGFQLLPALCLALPHQLLLLRTHSQPTLGISLKGLSLFG